MSDLVQRLRTIKWLGVCLEAADALEAQAVEVVNVRHMIFERDKRIAQLERELQFYMDWDESAQAERIASERVAKLSKDLLQNSYDLGFAQAIEMAAALVIAKVGPSFSADNLAGAIKALKPTQE